MIAESLDGGSREPFKKYRLASGTPSEGTSLALAAAVREKTANLMEAEHVRTLGLPMVVSFPSKRAGDLCATNGHIFGAKRLVALTVSGTKNPDVARTLASLQLSGRTQCELPARR